MVRQIPFSRTIDTLCPPLVSVGLVLCSSDRSRRTRRQTRDAVGVVPIVSFVFSNDVVDVGHEKPTLRKLVI